MSDIVADKCNYVADGDTFSTVKDVWIRLARVYAPDEGVLGYYAAKQLLSDLILNKIIAYEQIGTSLGRIVAEVWKDGNNINDIMIQAGYVNPQ